MGARGRRRRAHLFALVLAGAVTGAVLALAELRPRLQPRAVREGVRVRACVRPTGVLPPPGLNPDPRGARQPKWLRWRVGEWRQDELSAHDWRRPRALQGCVLCMRGVTRRLGVDSASRPSAQPICGHETRSAAQVEQTSRSTGAHVLREGGRPHRGRSAATPDAWAEPARWAAGWRRLRP